MLRIVLVRVQRRQVLRVRVGVVEELVLYDDVVLLRGRPIDQILHLIYERSFG